MKRALAALLIVVTVANSPRAAAQATTPLRPGRDSLTVSLVRGADTVKTGWIRDELLLRNESGVATVVRNYETQDRVLGNSVYTVRDRLSDLRPINASAHTSRGDLTVKFGPLLASGWLRSPSGDSIPLTVVLPPDAINSSTFDLLIRAAPLRAGWALDVPAVIAESGEVVQLTAHVAGEDVIDGVTTWRVEGVFTGMLVTFWVAKIDRHMVLQRMAPPGGFVILIRSTGK
ncbi:MAG: hypothetical protein V4558_16035 [Gemmatimonadota bacterium]